MSMSHELSKLLHEADMLQGHKYGQVSNIIANASPDLRRRLAEAIYPEGAGIGFLDALTEMLFDPNIEKKP